VRPDQIYEVAKILEFLNGRLNTDVKLSLPFSTILIKNITFLAIAIVAMAMLRYLRQVMLMPSVWFAIAMLTYLICTSGVVYSIIHNVPWFKMDRDQYGQVYISEYFMKGQRGQWAGEGYIFSSLVCITGLILLFLSRIDHFLKRSFHRRVGILLCLFAVFVLTQLILMCYLHKSSWYGPTFWPPSHY
jgi:hypothetical protein